MSLLLFHWVPAAVSQLGCDTVWIWHCHTRLRRRLQLCIHILQLSTFVHQPLQDITLNPSLHWHISSDLHQSYKKNCERRGFQIKDNWKKYAERCLENMDPFHILKVMQSPCLCRRVEHSRKVQLPGFYKTWWKSASFCGSWAWTFSRSSHSWSEILIGRLFILPVYSSPRLTCYVTSSRLTSSRLSCQCR